MTKHKRPRKLVQTISAMWSDKNYQNYYNRLKEEFGKVEKCGGKLVATLDLEEQPTWGSSYTELAINVKCQKCKKETSGLLDQEKVEEILTGYIDTIL